ncbi:uncharacterized protein LOC131160969 [Malania oleifera]|uniref:uncharacterized protein LOC131160969 n=1 Tax=Malania oleifera TaxID=397392 RepID=UPI0025AE19F9|nr:uncharacterized protein LOC131160969 [Malania oleifera]
MVDVESGHIRTEVETSLEGTRWDGVSEFGKDESCVWRLRATQRKKHGLFEITQYKGPHTRINETLLQDHPQLKSSLVANEVVEIIKSDAGASIATLQAHLRSKYQYHVSYRKVKWAWTEIPDANNAAILTCVFWSFAPSIEGFRHCPPVLYMDGTHLYVKYKGKLLIATAPDANQQIFPVAFAIVEEESLCTWSWFLKCIQDEVTDRDNLCLISDRHVGILAAIRQNDDWQPPRAHHRFCLRHIVNNFNQRVHNTMLKRMVEIAGREHQVRKFNSMMERTLTEGGPIVKSFFEEIPPHMWTQCHDGGRSACREASRQAMESGNGYTPQMLLQMQRREMAYVGHEVINFNIERGLFSIQTTLRPPNKGQNIQTVDIKGRRCTCGK